MKLPRGISNDFAKSTTFLFYRKNMIVFFFENRKNMIVEMPCYYIIVNASLILKYFATSLSLPIILTSFPPVFAKKTQLHTACLHLATNMNNNCQALQSVKLSLLTLSLVFSISILLSKLPCIKQQESYSKLEQILRNNFPFKYNFISRNPDRPQDVAYDIQIVGNLYTIICTRCLICHPHLALPNENQISQH